MRALLAAMLAAAVVASSADAAPRDRWFAAADARCAAATVQVRRLLATVTRVRTQADVLDFLRTGMRINEELLAALRAARPPAGDRRVASFLFLLDRSVRLDREAFAVLSAEGRSRRFDQLASQGRTAERGAQREAGKLRLRGCARYFDPKTYE
jgi:hypothetical protein